MTEELLDAVTSDHASMVAESEASAADAEFAAAAERIRQKDAEGAPEQIMPDDEAVKAVNEESNQEFERYLASQAPDEATLKARGEESGAAAVANITRGAWAMGKGFGKGVINTTGYAVAGLFDVANEFANTNVDFDNFIKAKFDLVPFAKPGEVPNPNDPVTPFGSIGAAMKPLLNRIEPWVADTYEKDNPIRTLVSVAGGWVGTKKFLTAAGVTKGLADAGRKAVAAARISGKAATAAEYAGKVGMSSLTTGVAQLWSLGEDDNVYRALDAIGIPEADARAYFNDEEEDTAFGQRVENAVNAAIANAAFEPVFDGALKTIAPVWRRITKLIRDGRQAANTAAARAAEVGDPTLEATVKAAQEHAKNFNEQLTALLGDRNAPLFVKPGARPDTTNLGTMAPLRSLKQLGTNIDEAAESVSKRAEATGTPHVPEPLHNAVNWSKINDESDVIRAMSDYQEAFEPEILAAVGDKQTLSFVEASSKELDGFQLVQNGMRGERLSDAGAIAVRDFYVLAMRKFVEVAKLHRAAPTDASRAAAAKLSDIVRNTQRVVRQESAARSRGLGVLRIPAKEAEGYGLYKEVQDLMGAANGDQSLDSLLTAIAKAADEGDMAKASNIALNAQGLRAVGAKIAEGYKTLYYFSMLSRLTTQIRNAVGSPAHFLMQLAESKTANVIGKLVDGEPAVYDGETSAKFIGFVHGMAEAFRLPELIESGQEIAKGDILAGVSRAANQMDEGVYGAFRQNKSSFGGSSISDSARQGPLFGDKPTHLWGHSTEENFGRVLSLIHAATVRPMKALLSTPGRGLNTVDELWKTAFARSEIRTLAYRQAYQEVRTGVTKSSSLASRVEAISANPNAWMNIRAEDAAREGTFTNMPTGRYGKWLQKTHELDYLGMLVVPFTRAPGNVTWQSLRRTPLGVLPAVDDFLKDITGSDLRKRDLAWSRFLVGNMAIASAIDFFMEGDRVQIVSDAKPESPAAGQQARRNLMTPLTVRISQNPEGGFENGKFIEVPFKGYDPVTFPFVIAGNMLHFIEQGAQNEEEMTAEDLVVSSASALASVLTANTSLSSLVQAMTSIPQNRFGEFMQNQLLTVPTPGMAEQFVPLFDDVYRETFNTFDKIRAATPGLSDGLPAARDAWGFVKKRKPGWAGVFQAISPTVRDIDEEVQPVDIWLGARGFAVGEPPKTKATFRDGVEIQWRNHTFAFEEYKWLAGNKMVFPERNPHVIAQIEAGNIQGPPSNWIAESSGGLAGELNDLVQGKSNPAMQFYFDHLPNDDARVGFINQAISFYRAAARELLLVDPKYGALAAEVRQKKSARAAQETDPKRAVRLRMGFGTDLKGDL